MHSLSRALDGVAVHARTHAQVCMQGHTHTHTKESRHWVKLRTRRKANRLILETHIHALKIRPRKQHNKVNLKAEVR